MSKQMTKHTKLIAAPKSNRVVSREAPEERTIGQFNEFVGSIANEAQWQALYGKTPKHAIRMRPGKGGQDFKYIPHGYVTDKLNKAFGFAWSFVLLPISGNDRFVLQVYDEETKKSTKQVRDVSVYGELTVHFFDKSRKLIASVTKPGGGSQRWEMGTEFGDAFKGAISDAKKNAAKELGIGLDLYYDDDAAIEQHETRQHQQRELQAEMETFNASEPEWVERAKALRGEGKSSKVIADALKVSIADVNKWSK